MSVDRLLDSIFIIGSPLTSRTSIGPPGVSSSKTPIASRPVYHAKGIEVGPLLLEDRPMCVLMVPKAHPFFDNSTRNFKGMAQPLRTMSALATKPNIVQHS